MMRLSILLLTLLLGAAQSVAEDEPDDTLGKHVVKAGENLWDITRHYLGDETLWRENWRLNPEIDDPNRLRIGQELTVIVERRIPAAQAQIRALSNDVQKNRQRTNWVPAEPGDALRARDGVRTLRDSSADLAINEQSSLHLTEYSQVFFQSRETTLREVDRGKIEVIEGSAELSFAPMRRNRTEIELISGPAATRPAPARDGSARLRTTVAEDGGARVMVYGGFGEVSAAGETVQVGSGLGSVVDETGPPGAPEKLLGSPRGLVPVDGTSWPVANVPLQWDAVAGAGRYIAEVCRDPDCSQLVRRNAGLEQAAWEVELEAAGNYYWRVTAVSHSGLEGYPSRARQLKVASAMRDLRGPAVAVIPVGFHRSMSDGGLLVAPRTTLRLEAFDDAVDVDRIDYRWGDGAWQQWEGKVLSLEGRAGLRLEARATDSLGKQGPVATIEVTGEASPRR